MKSYFGWIPSEEGEVRWAKKYCCRFADSKASGGPLKHCSSYPEEKENLEKKSLSFRLTPDLNQTCCPVCFPLVASKYETVAHWFLQVLLTGEKSDCHKPDKEINPVTLSDLWTLESTPCKESNFNAKIYAKHTLPPTQASSIWGTQQMQCKCNSTKQNSVLCPTGTHISVPV